MSTKELARLAIIKGAIDGVYTVKQAEQNSMRWQLRSGKEIYNTVWFNTKSL